MDKLNRFIEAQTPVYETVLQELCNGQKETHWMWFIFPQLKELGRSSTAVYYGLDGLDEAKTYSRHSLLGMRLNECIEAVLYSGATDVRRIFGYPDYLKFHSCLTLFSLAEPDNKLFQKALNRFYQGEKDNSTIKLLIK